MQEKNGSKNIIANIWANTYILQYGQIYFDIPTNVFGNLEKY